MSEIVEPYQGDPDDLVARLEWVKSHVMCTKPGRELVWATFDAAIDLAKMLLEVNESMRRDLVNASDAPRMQMPPPFEPDPTLFKQEKKW